MGNIRRAEARDASRLAEILIFTKRINYRRIFRDDRVSFGEMQVLPLALAYQEEPGALAGVWVYDDGIVKGMLHVEGQEVRELYVDPCFQGEGLGGALLDFAVGELGARQLFVLEKNGGAIRFYARHGFSPTGERQLEPGTAAYVLKMEKA